MEPPPAVNMVLLPLQMVVAGETVMEGLGLTVTTALAVTEQPFVVPVTVYVVVVEGEAETAAPPVAETPAAGDQL